jgi:hypothetical protein
MVLNWGYLYEGSLTPLREFEFSSQLLSGRPANAHSFVKGNRFRGRCLGSLPVPLPKNYLLGFDQIRYEHENGGTSYLFGVQRSGGWWYWYLAALGVKQPLGTSVLVVVGLVASLHRSIAQPYLRMDLLHLLAAPLALFAMVSFQSGFTHHMRYVVPVLPFVCILAGASALLVARRGIARVIPFICVIWSVGSSLSVYPHSLSYFNEFAGGARNGWKSLNNSNVDWGQDLLTLRTWTTNHPRATPMHVAFANYLNPNRFGVPCGTVESHSVVGQSGNRSFPPGWYAISLDMLARSDGDLVAFRRVVPVDYIGYSMHVYYLEQPLAVVDGRAPIQP